MCKVLYKHSFFLRPCSACGWGWRAGWAEKPRKALEPSASASLSETVIHHSYSPLVSDNYISSYSQDTVKYYTKKSATKSFESGRDETNVSRRASQASQLPNNESGQQPGRPVERGWLEQFGRWLSSPARCRAGPYMFRPVPPELSWIQITDN